MNVRSYLHTIAIDWRMKRFTFVGISLNWKRLDLRKKSDLKIVIFKDDIRFIRIISFSIKEMFIFKIINFCSELICLFLFSLFHERPLMTCTSRYSF